MSRTYCKNCRFPINACLCSEIEIVDLPIRVLIIQHPKEINHAKNTARLAKLVCSDIELIDFSDKPSLHAQLESVESASALVLYPNENSISLESWAINAFQEKAEAHCSLMSLNTIILLDASWPQAYGMYKTCSPLQQLKCCHFDYPPEKQYMFRKSKHSHELSTIEALSHALYLLYETDKSAFNRILKRRSEFWPQ